MPVQLVLMGHALHSVADIVLPVPEHWMCISCWSVLEHACRPGNLFSIELQHGMTSVLDADLDGCACTPGGPVVCHCRECISA